MKKKTLYILMENQVRELNSLILISIISAFRGYRVYVGSHYSILKLLEAKKDFGGVFINKGSSTIKDSHLIKKKCNKLVIIDQEISPGYSNYYYDYIIGARHYKKTLRYVDRYYCINEQVKKVAKKILLKENKKLKIISVGWPRFDIMNSQFSHIFQIKVKKLKKKYKKFILFNSDFGLISKKDIHVFDNTEIFSKQTKKFLNKHYKIKNSFKKHAIKDFEKTKNFLFSIAKNLKNTNIIIRPHPAENLMEWKSFCKTSKNFFFEKPIYDVSSAILASTHVVHRGCTTGYQSLVTRKKTGYLNLLKENTKTNNFRPSLLSLSKNIINNYQFNKWLKEKNNFNIKNNNKLKKVLNINKKFASERILDDLDSLLINSEEKHNKFNLYSYNEVKFHQFKNFLYDLLVKFGIKRERNFLSKFKPQKINEDFSRKNIEKTVKLFLKSKLFKNKLGKIKVRKISDVLFEFDKI